MSNRLYVGNLPFQVTEELISSRFAACGKVVSVSVIMDRETTFPHAAKRLEISSSVA